MIRIFITVFLFGVSSQHAFSSQTLFSEKVLFLKSHDPREISFVYEDGIKLRGVYTGVSWDTVWDLRSASSSQWFNLSYKTEHGLVLRHLSQDIEFMLVGQVDNHPLERLLSQCMSKAGGSSIGVQHCLSGHDRLIDIEIKRAYQLLRDYGEPVDHLYEAWEKFSSHQYSYIRKFYSKFQGSKWAHKSMEDIVAIDEAHLDMLNNWVARLISNMPADASVD